MDSVFMENRPLLVTGLDNLRAAQSRLDTITHKDHPDEHELQKNIDDVAQARAELLKTSTHMQLQLRNQMTDDQIKRVESLH